jgi:predicted dehydrogenase
MKTPSRKGTQRLDGGGALINQGIHGLDLLMVRDPLRCYAYRVVYRAVITVQLSVLIVHYGLGEDVVSATAQTAVRAHMNIEVADTCAAIFKFKSGASYGCVADGACPA